MAALAKFLQRRLLSTQSFHFDRTIVQASAGERYGFHKRGILTQTNPTKLEGLVNNEANTLKSSVKPVSSDIKFSANSSLKTSPRHDCAAVFTCKVCETRSVKTFCRESYEKGVVIATCGGCNNHHVLADHRGWFGEPGTIEDFLAARGEEIKSGSVDTLSLTLEDIAGKQA